MPKNRVTKDSVQALLRTVRDRSNGSTNLLYDGKVVGTMVTKGGPVTRSGKDGAGSKTVYLLYGTVDGVRFSEEATTGNAVKAKVAASLARGLNALPRLGADPSRDEVEAAQDAAPGR